MSKFKVDIFSPDGDFTEEEVKQLIEDGFRYQEVKKGELCRLSPIEVEEIQEEPPKKSAFQECNEKMGFPLQVSHSWDPRVGIEKHRKEGWNAAIYLIENWFCKVNPDQFQNYAKEKLKEMKEP